MSLQEIEEYEVKSLMDQAGLDPRYFIDLKTLGLGSVVAITSYRGGAFAQSPPHYLTLRALVHDAGSASTLGGVDKWPEDSDANYTSFMTMMTIFMRLCGRASEAAEERLLRASGVVGTTGEEKALAEKKRREEALKNHPTTYRELERNTEEMYNTQLQAECDTETTVKTHLCLLQQRMVTARLGSGKYGQKCIHFSENTLFKEDADHHLVVANGEEKVPMYRNATVLLAANSAVPGFVDVLTIAGGFDIDPISTHLAGPYGKINIGTAGERQLMFDMTTARKAERAFIELSGKCMFV